MDIRCEHKKHAEIHDGLLEVKCSSRFCGAAPGVVVIHVYSPTSGRLLETRKFRDVITNEEVEHGAR
jgi:hypothetical protein